MANTKKISVKVARKIDRPYAYLVTVRDDFGVDTVTVYTDANGEGLWIDGGQVEGAAQFSLRGKKDPRRAIRRYFEQNDML